MRKPAFLAISTALLPGATLAANDPMVGGAAMYPNKNIVENAMRSKDHVTLVTAIKACTPSSARPFHYVGVLPGGQPSSVTRPNSTTATTATT